MRRTEKESQKQRISRFLEIITAECFEGTSIDVNRLIDLGYFDAPASLKHHGKKEGDLFHHSLSVAKNLVQLTERNDLIWQRPASPWIVGLLHDLCKADDYVVTDIKELSNHEIKNIYGWNDKSIYTGHGDKSILMAAPIIQLTVEEVACIRWHMGAFDEKENWNRYGAAIEIWPNVLWTHNADMIAARIEGV